MNILDFELSLVCIKSFQDTLKSEKIMLLKPTIILEGEGFISCGDILGKMLLCAALTAKNIKHVDHADITVIKSEDLIAATGTIPAYQKPAETSLVPILRIENYLTGSQLTANEIIGLGIAKISPDLAVIEGRNGIVLQTLCNPASPFLNLKKQTLN